MAVAKGNSYLSAVAVPLVPYSLVVDYQWSIFRAPVSKWEKEPEMPAFGTK
jgi:hypothetical protein